VCDPKATGLVFNIGKLVVGAFGTSLSGLTAMVEG
jgi:hypothetical protein